jgi:predicted GH43/DUF377 family glycosyl hydrolase
VVTPASRDEAVPEALGDRGQRLRQARVLDEPADRLLLYYGAADTVIGLASARFSDVMARLREAG